jgi:hypothetical protein
MYALYIICIHENSKKTPPARTPPSPPAPPFTPAQLLRFFVQLLPGRALRRLPALQSKLFYDGLFTPVVILWYLLFQRLHSNHTLEAALSDARNGGADHLNKKLSRRLRSDSTSSYSDARQRLPWEFLLQALAVQARNLLALSKNTLWHGRVLALLDGSTVRLRPYGNLPQQFPGNRNQHGKPYWCLLRVTLCFCGVSGAALDCALDSIKVSEPVMACQIILRSAFPSLFMGDRAYGVFRVAQAARDVSQEVLLRMTTRRARKVLGRNLVPGDHPVCWKHSRHDQLEPGCSDEPIHGRLLVLWIQPPGFRRQLLCLFTTLPSTPDFTLRALAQLYGQRWQIEVNIRYLKAQMDLVQLEAKSANMARKEWLAGLLAYNLIRGAQLSAALLKGVTPMSLSFSRVRHRLECWLQTLAADPQAALRKWPCLLKQMGQCALPHRRKKRPAEPRAQRHLRLPYAPLYGSRAKARQKLLKSRMKS